MSAQQIVKQTTDNLRDEYASRGCHMAHAAFTAAEVAALVNEIEGKSGSYASEATVVEKNGKTVRSEYGGHGSSPLMQRLLRDERLVAPAMALLDDEVSVYQFKINIKAPFVGDLWPWHQDYAFWKHLDHMQKPHALSVAIYLDDVNEFNGPLFYIPGAHNAGLYPCEPSSDVGIDANEATTRGSDVSARLRFTLQPDIVDSLVSRHGLQSAQGPRGSAFFFHASLPHASGMNISPYQRRQVFITYNAMSNALRQPTGRAGYLVDHYSEPLRPIAGSLLS